MERPDERHVDGLHYHAVVRSVDENLQARMPVKIDVHVPDGTIFVQTASLADALEWISTDPFVPCKLRGVLLADESHMQALVWGKVCLPAGCHKDVTEPTVVELDQYMGGPRLS